MNFGLQNYKKYQVSGKMVFPVLFVKVETFRVLRLDVFIVVPDLSEVFLIIASGIKNPFNAAVFFLVVDETEENGHLGALGNDIEAFFPVVDGFSSAFGTNDEMGVLVLAEHVDHLFNEVVLVAAIYGNAAHLLKDPSDDGLEKLLLHHHLESVAIIPIKTKANKEILDGSMGCHDAHSVA